MWTFQFAIMQACAEKNGWTKFISMQVRNIGPETCHLPSNATAEPLQPALSGRRARNEQILRPHWGWLDSSMSTLQSCALFHAEKFTVGTALPWPPCSPGCRIRQHDQVTGREHVRHGAFGHGQEY